ncbi:hypothetical protein AB0K20_32570 [Micromonospora matsumotoense]|uniref:hypothetical protein n=1 Tax=Micromonospora matsumotoense TaxID=121616 RepID=UPI0034366BE3
MVTTLDLDYRSLAARTAGVYHHRGWWFRYLTELAMLEALLGGDPARPVEVLATEPTRRPLRADEAYGLHRHLARLRRVLAARGLPAELAAVAVTETAGEPNTDPVAPVASLFDLDPAALRSLVHAALRALPELYAHVESHPVDWAAMVAAAAEQQRARIRVLAAPHVSVIEVPDADLLFRR